MHQNGRYFFVRVIQYVRNDVTRNPLIYFLFYLKSFVTVLLLVLVIRHIHWWKLWQSCRLLKQIVRIYFHESFRTSGTNSITLRVIVVVEDDANSSRSLEVL